MSEESSVEKSRRKWLKAIGAGSVGLFAGCAGQGGDGGGEATPTPSPTKTPTKTPTPAVGPEEETETPTPTESGEGETESPTPTESEGGEAVQVLNQTFRAPSISNMAQLNFNLYATKNTPDISTQSMMNDQLAVFQARKGKWRGIMAKSWERDGDTARLNIRSGYQWHNGDSVTADDWVAQLTLDKAVGSQVWDFTKEVTAPDETTVEFTMSKVNTEVFWNALLENTLFVKPSIYKPHLQRVKDATTDEAMNTASKKLLNFQLGPDKAIGNGPFQLKSVDEQGVELRRYPDYPNANFFNWNRTRVKAYADAQGEYQAMLTNNIDVVDYRAGTPKTIVNKIRNKENWEVVTAPALENVGFGMNPHKEPLTDRRVRQAVAAIVNPYKHVQIGGFHNRNPSTWQTGLAVAQDDAWLGDTVKQFTKYGGKRSAPKMATNLLKEAGFSKQKGAWIDANGEPLVLNVKYPAGWSGGAKIFRHTAQQLSEFDIKSKPVGVENTTIFSKTIPNDDYKLIWMVHPGRHPYNRFRNMLGNFKHGAWLPSLEIGTVKVPWPVGNPEGSLKEINLTQRIRELGKTTDTDKAVRLTTELAWVWNQYLPMMEIFSKLNTHFINRANFKWPSQDNPWLHVNEPYDVMKLQKSFVQAKSS